MGPQIRFSPLISEEPVSTGTRSRHADADADEDDIISVDDPNESEDSAAALWTPFWKEVRTAMVVEAPKDIEIRSVYS
jgi:hypothetical protein